MKFKDRRTFLRVREAVLPSMTEDARNPDFIRQKRLLSMMLAGLMAAVWMMLPAHIAAAETASGGENVLIVYYSRTGNTRAMANHVQTLTGGKMVELEPAEPYPAEYRATTEQAKKELEADFKPPLKVTVDDIAPYDVIFVGSPCWWGTFASPVRTFLSQHDFSGKKLVPFITHEGSGMGKSMEDLKTLCPQAVMFEGLAVRGRETENAKPEIEQWLKQIRMIRQGQELSEK